MLLSDQTGVREMTSIELVPSNRLEAHGGIGRRTGFASSDANRPGRSYAGPERSEHARTLHPIIDELTISIDLVDVDR
jgi:hypothetical protein